MQTNSLVSNDKYEEELIFGMKVVRRMSFQKLSLE